MSWEEDSKNLLVRSANGSCLYVSESSDLVNSLVESKQPFTLFVLGSLSEKVPSSVSVKRVVVDRLDLVTSWLNLIDAFSTFCRAKRNDIALIGSPNELHAFCVAFLMYECAYPCHEAKDFLAEVLDWKVGELPTKQLRLLEAVSCGTHMHGRLTRQGQSTTGKMIRALGANVSKKKVFAYVVDGYFCYDYDEKNYLAWLQNKAPEDMTFAGPQTSTSLQPHRKILMKGNILSSDKKTANALKVTINTPKKKKVAELTFGSQAEMVRWICVLKHLQDGHVACMAPFNDEPQRASVLPQREFWHTFKLPKAHSTMSNHVIEVHELNDPIKYEQVRKSIAQGGRTKRATTLATASLTEISNVLASDAHMTDTYADHTDDNTPAADTSSGSWCTWCQS